MPIIHRSKTHVGVSTPRLFLRSAVQLLLFLSMCLSGTAFHAQTVEIKLVNGRDGRPVASKCIYVWVGDRSNRSSGPLLQTQTDKDGVAPLRLTQEGSQMSDQTQHLACGLSGVINPLVKYGDTISIRAGYVLCQTRTPTYSWLAMVDFSTKEVLQHGIATANNCGKATGSPKPGEVIIFVRPLSWWEKLKQ